MARRRLGVVALQRQASEGRVGVGVERIDVGDALEYRLQLRRVGDVRLPQQAGQLPRAFDVVEVVLDNRTQRRAAARAIGTSAAARSNACTASSVRPSFFSARPRATCTG